MCILETGREGRSGSSKEAALAVEMGQLFKGSCGRCQQRSALPWVCPEILGKAVNMAWLSGKRALLILFVYRSLGAFKYFVCLYVCVYVCVCTHSLPFSHTHIYVHIHTYVCMYFMYIDSFI